jgi:hypothetical protein
MRESVQLAEPLLSCSLDSGGIRRLHDRANKTSQLKEDSLLMDDSSVNHEMSDQITVNSWECQLM